MRTSTETRGVTDGIRGRASRLALLCVQRTAGRRWTAGLLELEIELRPTPIPMIGAFVMPSPFPGMDPFIESQRWQDFHTTFITIVREVLMPRVRPRYVVDVEQYVYLARGEEDPDRLIEPDLAIVDHTDSWTSEAFDGGGTALAVKPVVHTVPVPKRFRQAYLAIRSREFREVVTVIEVPPAIITH